MSTNIFGRETVNQYADLHASVLRIAEKSKEEPEESKGFKDISPQEALRNVQNTYAQMKQAPKEGKQEELVEKSKVEEGTSLQVKMALSDVNLKGTWKDGKHIIHSSVKTERIAATNGHHRQQLGQHDYHRIQG